MKRAHVALAFLVFAGCFNNSTDVGTPCTVTADCDPAHFCDTSSPGGFCTKGCTFEGTTTKECPSGSVCTYTGGTVMVCANTCKTDANCRDQYGCYPVKNSTLLACGPKRT